MGLAQGERVQPLQKLLEALLVEPVHQRALHINHRHAIDALSGARGFLGQLFGRALICLDARTIIASDGVGSAESVLYDERGRVGRAAQALLIAPR